MSADSLKQPSLPQTTNVSWLPNTTNVSWWMVISSLRLSEEALEDHQR